MRATESVWISNSSARVAHSPRGALTDDKWATRCGQPIQLGYSLPSGCWYVSEYGSLVEWRLLNHDLVRLCERCYPK